MKSKWVVSLWVIALMLCPAFAFAAEQDPAAVDLAVMTGEDATTVNVSADGTTVNVVADGTTVNVGGGAVEVDALYAPETAKDIKAEAKEATEEVKADEKEALEEIKAEEKEALEEAKM